MFDFLLGVLFSPLLSWWCFWFLMLARSAWSEDNLFIKFFYCGGSIAAALAGPAMMVGTQIKEGRPDLIFGCFVGMGLAFLYFKRS